MRSITSLIVVMLAMVPIAIMAVSSSESIYLTVAYCPTDFTGAGAVVKVLQFVISSIN
jgi:hypothetical protein